MKKFFGTQKNLNEILRMPLLLFVLKLNLFLFLSLKNVMFRFLRPFWIVFSLRLVILVRVLFMNCLVKLDLILTRLNVFFLVPILIAMKSAFAKRPFLLPFSTLATNPYLPNLTLHLFSFPPFPPLVSRLSLLLVLLDIPSLLLLFPSTNCRNPDMLLAIHLLELKWATFTRNPLPYSPHYPPLAHSYLKQWGSLESPPMQAIPQLPQTVSHHQIKLAGPPQSVTHILNFQLTYHFLVQIHL